LARAGIRGQTVGVAGTRGWAERERSDDSAAFAEMYGAYASRVHRFCVVLLRDDDLAADSMHDTFVLGAERLGDLRDPARLPAWLFAIARHVCFRRLERRRPDRLAVMGADPMVFEDDPIAPVSRPETIALAWAAASELGDRERAVLDLRLNEQMGDADIAAVLGEPQVDVPALTSRAREQLDRALDVLMTARIGRRECAALRELLQMWDGALTQLLRARLARHFDSCETCRRTRACTVPLSALEVHEDALLEPPRMTPWHDSMTPDELRLVAQRLPRRAEHWQADGFPPPSASPQPPERVASSGSERP
jgi:RNA polymerase sigma factor (sigma-70 family)